MYKIIVCDLDETLLGPDKKVSERNQEAIKLARNKGVKFVPTTGRGYFSVESTLKELQMYDAENEYVISYNGGIITENKNNRLIHFECLPFELAETLYKKGLSYDVCIHVYTKDTSYICNISEKERRYTSGRVNFKEVSENDLGFLKGQDIVKVLYMNTDKTYLQYIERELSPYAGELEISYSSNRYIEFNRKGVSKGNGLLVLAKLLGVPQKDTIAIGDNLNDLSMIKAAGLGVGVRNTIEEMKPLCDVITEAAYDENAVAEVIEKYVLSCDARDHLN